MHIFYMVGGGVMDELSSSVYGITINQKVLIIGGRSLH
jgi:hypothetical protein